MTNMKDTLPIAPCGMNCRLCRAFQREKNGCPGCYGPDTGKPNHCVSCRIRDCEELPRPLPSFCYHCTKFPCRRLKLLDARYRSKYGISIIENLWSIQTRGVAAFIELETMKWTCSICGKMLCVHRHACLACGNINEEFPGNTPPGGP
jgi:hypothetical protein